MRRPSGEGNLWWSYAHATDSGRLHEVFRTRLQRPPLADEVARFREHFVAAIDHATLRQPFREIAGAARMLSHLGTLPSFRVALATGAFSDSARCKLRSPGMSYDAFPAASADDALTEVAGHVSAEEVLASSLAS